ncbi:MAG: hypothetical protein HY731_08155 [Candidatus Tectomicrobia bacterium]|nr:hypothetical protein [Candidatus Tectomicrobia bacterium]
MKEERENNSGFRVVPDTNVIVASKVSKSQHSPNKEFINRWFHREFALLYSEDTQVEYTKKLLEKRVPEAEIARFLSDLETLGERIEIQHYHFPHYPEDRKDIPFVLCAENGEGTQGKGLR